MPVGSDCLISIVVPLFNEGDGVETLHESLLRTLKDIKIDSYEIIYCNDGSTDATAAIINSLASSDHHVKVISLSRNFGKEIAITAGIHAARGQAIITLDADGQHPVELIPEFISRWKTGKKVVVGVRASNQGEGFVKRYGSRLFYKLFNRFTGITLLPGATDFRLIDKRVQHDFNRLTERNRISRGLIDWLGYEQDFVYFTANARISGESTYSHKKLFKLAIDSVVSLSISPLYISAYIGAFILPVSGLIGIGMLVNDILSDPLHLNATGSAYVTILILFLIGVLLISQGIIGLYLSHIHAESLNRPLYIIDHDKSKGI